MHDTTLRLEMPVIPFAGPRPLSLRVAIVGTNSPFAYSGGRYHALMSAYALAAAGAEVHVITDHAPIFIADFEPLTSRLPQFHSSKDFRTGVPGGKFDFVIVVPTGIFLPEFYEAAFEFARGARARLVLINFESANWFNRVAPVPRDPRLWDYWRRTCVDGGLVLSSTRVSDVWARSFYGRDRSGIRFEVWRPAINSTACRKSEHLEKNGSVVAFVRPSDEHKGADDLYMLDPEVLKGRMLNLISGKDLDAGFCSAIVKHFKKSGCQVDVQLRISDDAKFKLLNAAQALFFPSKFEGFGYPPVEAAYAGTESVCYDLPVLRETVGTVGHFATIGDSVGLSAALEAALRMPPRREFLRQAVAAFADFDSSSALLADILLRCKEVIEPVKPQSFRSAWGPWAKATPLASSEFDRASEVSPLPATAKSVRRLADGRLLLSLALSTRGAIEHLRVRTAQGTEITATYVSESGLGLWSLSTLHCVAPASALASPLSIEVRGRDEPQATMYAFRVDTVADPAPMRPTLAGVSEVRNTASGTFLRAWLLSAYTVTHVLLTSDQKSWHSASALTQCKDRSNKHLGYPSYVCEFNVSLPPDVVLGPSTQLFALRGGVLVDTLEGWPPRVRLPTIPLALTTPTESPEATRSAVASIVDVPRLDIVDITDGYWLKGIVRNGPPTKPSIVAIRLTGAAGSVSAGTIIRLASGRVARVTSVEKRAESFNLTLNIAAIPYVDGYPAKIEMIQQPATAEAKVAEILSLSLSDDFWWNGVWMGLDSWRRRGLRIEKSGAAGEIRCGSTLQFVKSGVRKVLAVEDVDDSLRVWLDGSIAPLADGAPHKIFLITGQYSGTPITLVPLTDGVWMNGVLCNLGRGRGVRLRIHGDEQSLSLKPGAAIRFAASGLRRVISIASVDADVIEIELDSGVDAVLDGAPNSAMLASAAQQADGIRTTPVYRVPDYPLRRPLHSKLLCEAVWNGRAVPAVRKVLAQDRPRVLFITPVPPYPANQGNRVVTRNLILHLLRLGFSVDVLLQGWGQMGDFPTEFGNRVRMLSTNTPPWTESLDHKSRAAIRASVEATGAIDGVDAFVTRELRKTLGWYHPYFIVSDQTVEMAKALFRSNHYETIVCNYTHMVRVVKELEAIAPTPRTAVITHDALSRLPTEFGGQLLDTSYRACSAAVERDVLNAIDDSVVVAISASEGSYFRNIGVHRRIVRCEYDGLEETCERMSPPSEFYKRRMVFHASANPMNVAGLNWFIDECWSDILHRIPKARLIVCGRIGEIWTKPIQNVEIMGDVSREKMFAVLETCSVAINPCIAGTGLKIKTVEAACLGLPSVCLPHAVDGLQDIASSFASVVDSPKAFVDACVVLLTDQARWLEMSQGARRRAEERFTERTVYQDLDSAMGWSSGAVARRLTPQPAFATHMGLRAGAEDILPILADSSVALESVNSDTASQAARGFRLAQAGQATVGRPILERATVERPGDPYAAHMAATAALEDGDGSMAALHASVIIAQRPAEAEGYYLLGQALMLSGAKNDAADTFLQCLALNPDDDRIRVAAQDACRMTNRESEFAPFEAVVALDMKLGEKLFLKTSVVGTRRLGPGWSTPESWGCWTDGVAARLKLRIGEPLNDPTLVLFGKAITDPMAEPLKVIVALDGEILGTWDVERNGVRRFLPSTIPSRLLQDRREMTLELLIGNPSRKPLNGQTGNKRILGLAVEWVLLTNKALTDFAVNPRALDTTVRATIS